MEHDKKLAFVAQMTDKALQHVAATPNVMTPKGQMSHEKMLSFVNQMAKQGLQHFDAGGQVLGVGGVTAPGQATTAPSWIGSLDGTANLTRSGALGGPNSTANQALGFIQGFNPINGLQSATQNQFQAQAANITPGTNVDQLNNSYGQVQSGLGQQQSFANQLAGQNGVGNQTNVFNQQLALANQLQAGANGQGPNAAQASLNQNTRQNINQQAALMAGQRGAGANAGLLASQAAQQGAQTQQQAIGQSAAQAAQQQIAYTNALQSQQNNLANVAQNQVNQQGQAVSGLNTGAQNEQNLLLGANTALNNANVSQQSNLNSVNAGISQGNQQASNGLLGGIFNGASSLLSSLNKGGTVKKMADGGDVEADFGSANYTAPESVSTPGVTSFTSADEGSAFKSSGGSGGGGGGGGGSLLSLAALLAKGGRVTAMPAPAGIGRPQSYAGQWLCGGGKLMKTGGKVMASNSSQKAVKKNDSLKNDKIPAMLSEGEIVLPRSITTHPNAPAMAAAFVAKELAKRKKK